MLIFRCVVDKKVDVIQVIDRDIASPTQVDNEHIATPPIVDYHYENDYEPRLRQFLFLKFFHTNRIRPRFGSSVVFKTYCVKKTGNYQV